MSLRFVGASPLDDKRSSDLTSHPAAAIRGSWRRVFGDRLWNRMAKHIVQDLNGRRPRWTGTGSKEIGSK
jgi:hypothetical protein